MAGRVQEFLRVDPGPGSWVCSPCRGRIVHRIRTVLVFKMMIESSRSAGFFIAHENRERLGALVTLAYFKKIRALSMIECLQDMEI